MLLKTDIFGIICTITTYLVVSYVDYVVTVHLIGGSMSYSVWGLMNIVFFNAILLLLVLSHIRAMTCDPGVVTSSLSNHDYAAMNSEKCQKQEGQHSANFCSKCEVVRPPRAYHCNKCRRCVRRFDHHCPWINNCIGELNQKYLLMFVFYVVLASSYAVTMMATYWLIHPPHLSKAVLHTKMLHTGVLACLCTILSIFSVLTALDQVAAVKNYFERESGSMILSTKEALSEVFGNIHPILWLIPLRLSAKRTGQRQPLL